MKSGSFNAKRIGRHLAASYHLVWRGVVACFICRACQSLIVKTDFQHHAFFFVLFHSVLVENLNELCMESEVEKILFRAKAKAKQEIADRLELFELVEVAEPSKGYDLTKFDNGKWRFFKKQYLDISDEEYEQLMKYYPPVEPMKQKFKLEEEDNGENYITTFAKVWLVLLIIVAFVIFVAGVVLSDKLFGFNMGLFLCYVSGSAIAIVLGFFTYFMVKVYTNISRKASAIYQLLKSRE